MADVSTWQYRLVRTCVWRAYRKTCRKSNQLWGKVEWCHTFPNSIYSIWGTSSIFRQHYTTGICNSLQIFRISGTHIQILGARKLTWHVSHNDGPQVWSDLWTSLISGAFCSLHAIWYTFLYVRGNVQWSCWKILVAAVWSLVTRDLCASEYKQRCHCLCYYRPWQSFGREQWRFSIDTCSTLRNYVSPCASCPQVDDGSEIYPR